MLEIPPPPILAFASFRALGGGGKWQLDDGWELTVLGIAMENEGPTAPRVGLVGLGLTISILVILLLGFWQE